MVSRVFVLCLLVGVAMAATFQGKAPKKPAHLAHKEGCYVEEMNDVIPSGSMATPKGHCYRVECSGEYIYGATCGVVYTNDPKCHKTSEDLTKPYPDCCPGIKCEEDNKV